MCSCVESAALMYPAVANADDPVLAATVRAAGVPAVWVAAGAHWLADNLFTGNQSIVILDLL